MTWRLLDCCASEYTLNGTDVRVVTAPADGDVIGFGHKVVCRVEIEPTCGPAIDTSPGVRGISADHSRLARRRDRS